MEERDEKRNGGDVDTSVNPSHHGKMDFCVHRRVGLAHVYRASTNRGKTGNLLCSPPAPSIQSLYNVFQLFGRHQYRKLDIIKAQKRTDEGCGCSRADEAMAKREIIDKPLFIVGGHGSTIVHRMCPGTGANETGDSYTFEWKKYAKAINLPVRKMGRGPSQNRHGIIWMEAASGVPKDEIAIGDN